MARCFFMGHTFGAMQATNPAIPQPAVVLELKPVREALRDGAHARALEALEALEKRFPLSGLVRQERANYFKAIGDLPSAVAAYSSAVAANDALLESWRELLQWERAHGRLAEADQAARSIAKLQGAPAELLARSSLLNEGELDAAEDVIRAYLVRHGAHIEGMRLLAQLAIKRDVLDDAELLLEKVVELAPDYHDARFELASVLQHRRRHFPALLQVQSLLRISPDNRSWLRLYADICDGLGKYEAALPVWQRLLENEPGDVTLQMRIAHALRLQRKTPEALEIFRNVARLPRGGEEAFLALANLKTYRFTDEELDAMRRAEQATDLSDPERYRLCFGLGTALEHRKEYEASFHYYQRGNALKRAEIIYKPELVERARRLQEQVCTAGFFAARRGWGCPRPDPIFILGMPRSGSTLVEQILSSHSQVDGTMELPELPRLVQQFRTRREEDPPKYPGILTTFSPQEARQLGEIYLEETRVYREGAPFFIDKMLGNFRDVGFIHLTLPNARIIDARREAMACCFGNYKQLFNDGQSFTYDLTELGTYYRHYVGLMDHWDRVLPGKVLRVRHEDVVADLEGSVRRLLDYCGLPFEPACLEFHKTERSVRTLSAEQVRRPINSQGLALWRNYEPWLGPLKEALGPLADSPDPAA